MSNKNNTTEKPELHNLKSKNTTIYVFTKKFEHEAGFRGKKKIMKLQNKIHMQRYAANI